MAAGRGDPCRLVTLSEARTITQGISAAVEAPLGPTCIYESIGSASPITVAVEHMNFTHVRRLLHEFRAVTVAGHSAACGKLGMRMLLAPLANGRVLNVTAPCSVAQRFAALAMARLSA